MQNLVVLVCALFLPIFVGPKAVNAIFWPYVLTCEATENEHLGSNNSNRKPPPAEQVGGACKMVGNNKMVVIAHWAMAMANNLMSARGQSSQRNYS